MATARSCHSRRGGYRIPTYVLTDLAEREARQAELDKQYEEQCRGKVGIDPTVEYHPVLNPTQDEVEQRERSLRESAEREKLRKLSDTQIEYYRKAVDLIKSGGVKSYADLGQRFVHSYGRNKGKPFGAKWAFYLVEKIIARNTIRREEVERLIPDRSSPFKRKTI